MKIIQMLISAVCIIAVVGTALAFKANRFMYGNVWCFTSIPVSSRPCSVDPGGTNIYVNTVITGGTNINPCTDGSPFISTVDNCDSPPVGQEYIATGE